jgi:hypothetical protein
VQIFKLTQKFSQLRILTLFQNLYDYTAPLCCVLPSCVLLLRPAAASCHFLQFIDLFVYGSLFWWH